MIDRPSTVLIVGATGSIGRHAVTEALRQGYAVRALVRDHARAARLLPESVDLVIGDLTRPETVGPAVDGVDAIVFIHGSTTSERDVRDNLTAVFTSLTPDSVESLDAAEDIVDLPVAIEPEMFRHDLATITARSLKAGD